MGSCNENLVMDEKGIRLANLESKASLANIKRDITEYTPHATHLDVHEAR